MATVRSIYRYPVKGLSPEPLAHTKLAPGETVPGDRLYAIENGPSGFDPQKPAYLSKQHFLMLMKNERLANLRTSFDHESHVLTIHVPSPHVGVGANANDPFPNKISGRLDTAKGRNRIESFFAAYCAAELRGPPKILRAEGHSFSDVARKVVSIINLTSVAAIEDIVGEPVNPLRFRANIYVEGWPAWSELDLVGKRLNIAPHGADARFHSVAPARLTVVKRIVRCAATNVDPVTGIRDLNLPQTLLRRNGHADCGIYAEVVKGGEIAAGDRIEII